MSTSAALTGIPADPSSATSALVRNKDEQDRGGCVGLHRRAAPVLRVEGEAIHEVSPSRPAFVPIPEHARRDRVAVGLVSNQDAAEVLARRWAQRPEQVAKGLRRSREGEWTQPM